MEFPKIFIFIFTTISLLFLAHSTRPPRCNPKKTHCSSLKPIQEDRSMSISKEQDQSQNVSNQQQQQQQKEPDQQSKKSKEDIEHKRTLLQKLALKRNAKSERQQVIQIAKGEEWAEVAKVAGWGFNFHGNAELGQQFAEWKVRFRAIQRWMDHLRAKGKFCMTKKQCNKKLAALALKPKFFQKDGEFLPILDAIPILQEATKEVYQMGLSNAKNTQIDKGPSSPIRDRIAANQRQTNMMAKLRTKCQKPFEFENRPQWEFLEKLRTTLTSSTDKAEQKEALRGLKICKAYLDKDEFFGNFYWALKEHPELEKYRKIDA